MGLSCHRVVGTVQPIFSAQTNLSEIGLPDQTTLDPTELILTDGGRRKFTAATAFHHALQRRHFVLFNWIGGDPAYMLAGKIAHAVPPETRERVRQRPPELGDQRIEDGRRGGDRLHTAQHPRQEPPPRG